MRLENDLKLDFKDVMIRPKRSSLVSRSEVSLQRLFRIKHSTQNLFGIPIIAANMDTVGTFKMAEALSKNGMFTALHKFYKEKELIKFFTKNTAIYTLGTTPEDLGKFGRVYAHFGHPKVNPIQMVCIDVANGYTEQFVKFVSEFRVLYPKVILIAGNVVTAEMTEQLILSGADIVKVGLGSGAACLTRSMTGVGYPQLSAIIECADAAHGLGGLICSDGGCQTPGDIAKAFGAGADFVMLGRMLAGHKECGTDKFYGMSSTEAMEKHYGKVKKYRASEGQSILIGNRGPVEGTIQEILGGLRSTCTYVGAASLKELSKRTTFIRVNE